MGRSGRLQLSTLAAVGLAIACVASTARAETLEGPDVWVVYPKHAQAPAKLICRAFPHLRSDISRWLGVPTKGRVTIYLVEDFEEMQRYVGSWASPWMAGACSPPGVIGIRLDLVERYGVRLDQLLTHETVHHVLSSLPGPMLPRWFEEGLATFRAEGVTGEFGSSLPSLREVVDLPSFDEIENIEDDQTLYVPLVYAAGVSAVGFFLDRHGEEGLRSVLAALRDGKSFQEAFREITGAGVEEFEQRWRTHVEQAGPPLLPGWAQAVLVVLLLCGLVFGIRRWNRYRRPWER